MPRIVILTHRHDPFENANYWLGEVAGIWRRNGFDVRVLHGPGPLDDADVAVLHVDSTVVPESHLAFIRRYPKVLNGRVVDTSKRITSNHRVSPGDGHQGPVIVKTNRNYRGRREATLAFKGLLPQRLADIRPNYSTFIKETVRAVKELMSPGCPGLLRGYAIFESVRQVPRHIWENPDLVVERFLPERRDDGLYCVRTWLFLGAQERNTLFYAKDPIIKSSNIIGREPLSDVPKELRSIREQLGFDFGKFDYAISEGRVVLYDANRTPTMGHFAKDQCRSIVELLSQGIEAYL